MNTLAEFLVERPLEIASPELTAGGAQDAAETPCQSNWIHDEQIRGLVQQLFFQCEKPARHVGFTAIETGVDIAPICLDVGIVLADSGCLNVGLIDASLQSTPLHTRLEIEPDSADIPQPLGPHLRLVSRRNWLTDGSMQSVWSPSLSLLRLATLGFDYSVVALDSLSWVTARISQVCDGLVLVLSANRTRRQVALQVREQLRRTRIPVLGVVLAERRFPIPEGLYHAL